MLTFFKAGITNIRQTGSLVESSSYLREGMTSIIDFSKPLNIVELGAGTGSITKYLLERMNASSRLFSLEINKLLYRKLDNNIQDSRLVAINNDASRLNDYISNGSADYILSALPLSNIKSKDKNVILKACHRALGPDSYFIQFQYSLQDFRYLKRHFSNVSCRFVPINFPPAFVYYAKKSPELKPC